LDARLNTNPDVLLGWKTGSASRVCPPHDARTLSGRRGPTERADTAVDLPSEHLLTAVLAVRIAGDDLRSATRYLLARAVRAGAEQIRRENREAR
jgi:hypothetical protein